MVSTLEKSAIAAITPDLKYGQGPKALPSAIVPYRLAGHTQDQRAFINDVEQVMTLAQETHGGFAEHNFQKSVQLVMDIATLCAPGQSLAQQAIDQLWVQAPTAMKAKRPKVVVLVANEVLVEKITTQGAL